MAVQFLPQLALDENSGILYDAVSERALLNGLSAAQVASVQVLVASGRTLDLVSRLITADDNGRLLAPLAGVTYTIPAGLSPPPSFSVDPSAAGPVVIAVSGGSTANGGTASLSRSRAANVVGFVVVAHNETDAYGVSGV